MEFLLFLLAGLGGILFHIVMKIRDAISKTPKNGMSPKERFNLVMTTFDFLGAVSYGLFAFMLIIFIAAFRDSLNQVGIPVTMITIVFYGYAADSTFKNLKPEKL